MTPCGSATTRPKLPRPPTRTSRSQPGTSKGFQPGLTPVRWSKREFYRSSTPGSPTSGPGWAKSGPPRRWNVLKRPCWPTPRSSVLRGNNDGQGASGSGSQGVSEGPVAGSLRLLLARHQPGQRPRAPLIVTGPPPGAPGPWWALLLAPPDFARLRASWSVGQAAKLTDSGLYTNVGCVVFDTWYDSTYQPSSPLVDRCNALIELGRRATWPTGFQRPFNALVTGALDQEIATLQTEPGRGVAVLIGRGLGLTPAGDDFLLGY